MEKQIMTEEVQRKSKIEYISLLSVVAALAVVFMHANNNFWGISPAEPKWAIGNVIETVCYFAVPIFFMISGATLIDFYDKYSLKEYFKKRVIKVVIPFIIWTFFGAAFVIVTGLKDSSCLTPSNIANALLNGKGIVDIYWFFPHIITAYLCIPLFALVNKEKRKMIFSFLVIAGFVLNNLFPFAVRTLGKNLNSSITVPVTASYLIFVLAGYLISHYDMKLLFRLITYVLGVCGMLIQLLGTYILSVNEGSIVTTYKGYVNVPCILYSVGIFVFFKYCAGNLMNIKWISRVVMFLAGYTFALYLIHWYILQLAILYLPLDPRSMLFSLGMPFVAFLITVVLVWLIRKIPVVRRIVP